MAEEKEKKVIKMNDKTTVYATGGGVGKSGIRHLAAGDEMSVHPELAKKLIKAGKATDKASKQ